MNRLKRAATRIVEGHGGMVNQFVGDEVMALFGVPRAHDDDPIRAVRAAFELHAAVRELGDELAPRLGRALRLHTAVDTGLMITQLRDPPGRRLRRDRQRDQHRRAPGQAGGRATRC